MKNVKNRLDFSAKEAKKWLKRTHDYHHIGFVNGQLQLIKDEFKYLGKEKSDSGEIRHIFGGSGMIFFVLSKKEVKKIEERFKQKVKKSANKYAYLDTISFSKDEVLHRFHCPKSHNTAITFMNDDDGQIWGGVNIEIENFG